MPKGAERLDEGTINMILGRSDVDERDKTVLRAHEGDPDAVPLSTVLASPALARLIEQAAAREGRKAGRLAAEDAMERASIPEEDTVLAPAAPAPATAPSDPFAAMLAELKGASGAEGRTELLLRLYHLQKGSSGPSSLVFCDEWALGPADLTEVDLGLERRAREYAEGQNRWGVFEWKIKPYVGGKLIDDLSRRVRLEAPVGYVAPAAPQEHVAPIPPPPSAEDQLDRTLGLMERMGKVFGGGGGGGKADTDTVKLAARSEALLEADRELRKELRAQEDRHEVRMEAAKVEAYNRGVVDGRRAAEDELRPKLHELERKIESGKEPSIIKEAVDMMGGADVVASLTKLAISRMEGGQPRQVQRQAPPTQATTAPPPPAAQQALPPLPEPTRAQWREALAETEGALAILEESGDTSPETTQAKAALAAFRDAGLVEGPLGNWWMAWEKGYRTAAHAVLESQDADEGDGEMDMDGMKALLVQRLNEGAEDAAILAELDGLTTAETRASWRKLLKWMPLNAAAQMIGDGQHVERLEQLLGTFMAAS